jgi:hypothetical protein
MSTVLPQAPPAPDGVWRGSAVVAGSRRARAALTTQLAAAGWDVVVTSDVNLALHHVRQLQPDVVAFELRLARAGHRARLASIQVIAPATMFVTFGPDRPEACTRELADLGVWCHLGGPHELPVAQLLGRLRVLFALALDGMDVVLPRSSASL